MRAKALLGIIIPLGMWTTASAAPPLAVAEPNDSTTELAPMSLTSYDSIPRNIVSARVFEQDGDVLGTVYTVALRQTGQPESIDVWLGATGRLITVKAPNISYDEQKRVVIVADMR